MANRSYRSGKKVSLSISNPGEWSQDLMRTWMAIAVMVAFFFPLTITVILFNGSGLGLILTAILAMLLVVIPNLWTKGSHYLLLSLWIGIAMDLGVIITSFLIK